MAPPQQAPTPGREQITLENPRNSNFSAYNKRERNKGGWPPGPLEMGAFINEVMHIGGGGKLNNDIR